MALSPENKVYMSNQPLSPEEEMHLIIDVPHELKPGHPVENQLGTWHMDGGLAIFDAGMHISENHISRISKVTDINAYTTSILEKELKNEDIQTVKVKPSVRRPLSIRKIAASITTFGF